MVVMNDSRRPRSAYGSAVDEEEHARDDGQEGQDQRTVRDAHIEHRQEVAKNDPDAE